MTQKLDAIVMGTGPGLEGWLNQGDNQYLNSSNRPKMFGCGKVPHYMNGLDYYCYADSDNIKNIPLTPDGKPNQWHPNCKVYSAHRSIADAPNMINFEELRIPHGYSSGAMALSLACASFYDRVEGKLEVKFKTLCFTPISIGIIGFDGDAKRMGHANHRDYDEFYFGMVSVIQWWRDLGVKIISLMETSVFNEYCDESPIVQALPNTIPQKVNQQNESIATSYPG